MKCELVFYIGPEKKEVKLQIDNQNDDHKINAEDIIKAINNDTNNNLYNAIYEASQAGLYKPVKYKDIIGSGDSKAILRPNATTAFLFQEFGIQFDDEYKDVDILLINNLTIGKQNIRDRVITQDGREIFVISGKRDKDGVPRDIVKLRSFLKVRYLINNDFDSKIDQNSDLYKKLDVLKTESRSQSIKEMLLDYIYDRRKYDKYIITYGEKSYNGSTILKEALNKIDISQYKTRYDSNLINAIINTATFNGDGNVLKYYVNFSTFYNLLKTYKSDLIKNKDLDLTSAKKMKELFSKKFSELTEEQKTAIKTIFNLQDDEVQALNTSEQPLYDFIFKKITEEDPTFEWTYNSVSKNSIVLTYNIETIGEQFNIQYSTIYEKGIIDNYKGYNIYQFQKDNKAFYFAARGYVDENFIGATFTGTDAIAKLKNYIDNRIQYQVLRKESFLDLKRMQGRRMLANANQYFPEGAIVQSLEIPNVNIDYSVSLLQREQQLLDGTLIDFYEYIDSNYKDKANKIKEIIDTPEKAVIFLYYKQNEFNKLDATATQEDRNKTIDTILDNIKNASSNETPTDGGKSPLYANMKYYYVSRRTALTDKNGETTGQYNYLLLPTNIATIDAYAKGEHQNIVIRSHFNAITRILHKKFGIQSKLITDDDFGKGELEDMKAEQGIKAFVLNDTVYINISQASVDDALHEYLHIIFAYMKGNQKLAPRYVQLMQTFAGQKYGGKTYLQIAQEMKKDIYEDYSDMEMIEELFCRKFSKYIINGKFDGGKNEFYNLFSSTLDQGIASLFNINTEKYDMQSIYKCGVYNIFQTFDKDINYLVKESNKNTFKNTKQTRQKVQWIRNQIKDKKIKEECS